MDAQDGQDFRLAALVPAPHFNMIRYSGVLAPAAAWRARLVPRRQELGVEAGVEASQTSSGSADSAGSAQTATGSGFRGRGRRGRRPVTGRRVAAQEKKMKRFGFFEPAPGVLYRVAAWPDELFATKTRV